MLTKSGPGTLSLTTSANTITGQIDLDVARKANREVQAYFAEQLALHRDNPVAYMEFKNPFWYTLIATLMLAAGLVASMLIESTRFGLALLAIRQNELAAEAAGIDARKWKMRSLVAMASSSATTRLRLMFEEPRQNMRSGAGSTLASRSPTTRPVGRFRMSPKLPSFAE